MTAQWQKIDSCTSPTSTLTQTWRLAVPGGWLVRVSEMHVGGFLGFSERITTAVTFFPDPEHKWSVTP